jgi:hypothetical protein
MKTTISLRVEVEEAEKWKEKAGSGSLSEWIREQCNLTASGQAVVLKSGVEQSGEVDGISELPRGGEVSTPRRRKSVSVGPLASIECSHCGHGKAMHRGFGTACIQDDCRCGGFR